MLLYHKNVQRKQCQSRLNFVHFFGVKNVQNLGVIDMTKGQILAEGRFAMTGKSTTRFSCKEFCVMRLNSTDILLLIAPISFYSDFWLLQFFYFP